MNTNTKVKKKNNELFELLKATSNWNKARIKCLLAKVNSISTQSNELWQKERLKLLMLVDRVVSWFIKITEVKVCDNDLLKKLKLIWYGMVVFNCTCNYCTQFTLWISKLFFSYSYQVKCALYTDLSVAGTSKTKRDSDGTSKKII